MDSTAVEVSVDYDQRIKELGQQVAKLQRRHDDHVEIAEELKHAWRAFERSNFSKRGLDGGRGETGPVGPAGRDMVLVVRTDTATNTIQVFDESGSEKARIFAVPGPKGETGATSVVPGPRGAQGTPGVAPSLDEVVAKVLTELHLRLKK